LENKSFEKNGLIKYLKDFVIEFGDDNNYDNHDEEELID